MYFCMLCCIFDDFVGIRVDFFGKMIDFFTKSCFNIFSFYEF